MPKDPFEPSVRKNKARKVPFAFVLDAIAPLDPVTRPMFGCVAVYVGERIVFALRDKGPGDVDNGVWLAFGPHYEEELKALFPMLAPIEIFAGKVSGWMKLSSRDPAFEDAVNALCEMLCRGDVRLGKIPGAKKKKPAGG